MSDLYLIAADVLIPVGAPAILEPAGLVIQESAREGEGGKGGGGGRIEAVGQLEDLRRDFGELPVRGRHQGMLVPGLVNAHTHLELSYHRDRFRSAAPGHFTQWVSDLMSHYPPADALTDVVSEAVRSGVKESLGYGVTMVGDISRQHTIVRPILAQSPLRAVSFAEMVSLGKMRPGLPERLQAAEESAHAAHASTLSEHNFHLIAGLSPHAPYTVEGPALQDMVQEAIVRRLPMAMHLAELSEERDFLRDLSGALGRQWDLMQKLDILDDQIPLFRGGPIRWAQQWGLLVNAPRKFPTLLAHANHLDDAELQLLAASQASVAYCPRTHAYFGHGPHRYREMLAKGINVSLGTDSLASNPDLSVLRETQLLVRRDGIDPAAALEMITIRGAQALGLEDRIGSLAVGKLADCAVFPIDTKTTIDPLRQLMEEAPRPTAVYVGGNRIDML